MTHTTKRGSYDNVITYEHICDTTADLQKIKPEYINLGSVAIVLQGDNGLEVYMANSQKEWIPLLENAGGGDNDTDNFQVIHILPEAQEVTWSNLYNTYSTANLNNMDYTNFSTVFPDVATYNRHLIYAKIKIDETEYIFRGVGTSSSSNNVFIFDLADGAYFNFSINRENNIASLATTQTLFQPEQKSLIEYIDIYYKSLISK